MLHAQSPRHDWPDAPMPDAAALPAPIVMCDACEVMEVCANGPLPMGWATETLAGFTRVYCPDCAVDLPSISAGHGLFEASLYGEEQPLAAVVHCKGRWFGLTHAVSAQVLAHQFGEFGFWRVKGRGQ